jgi:dTMP kinase
MARRGRLVVIEGGDGSGKTTQGELLISYLAKRKIPNAYISFPRYDKPWGKMIRRYLDGDFGEIGQVDPYFASVLYAGDRLAAAPQIRRWITQGKIVVCNRYIGSNIGHMGAKLKSQSEKSKYIKWLEDLEYRENQIPKEDLVVLLAVDPKVSRKLMRDRKLDIHEKDLEYQEEVFKVYDSQVKRKKNWVKVNCTKSGEIMGAGEIHEKILAILKKRRLI